MRTIVISILALAIYSLNLMADDQKPAEPTEKQLEDAKEAYAKFGAKYKTMKTPMAKRTLRTLCKFNMPMKTTDADLKGLPDLPFSFALDLYQTQVTDAGLRELKELKHLLWLNIRGTKVTDAGLRELTELKLTGLFLGGKQFTDVGLKEIKELKQLTSLVLDGTTVTDAGLK